VNLVATAIWLLCLSLETSGQLAFKAANIRTEYLDGAQQWKAMLSHYLIWLGISSYVIEFFAYMAFVSIVPLSQGVLLSSCSIMTIMIGGRILFAEKLTPKRLISAGLIAIGVVLVGWV
jgi:drug/metabolite transporter (DMT)-like permease